MREKELEKILKALANQRRLRIIRLLFKRKELPVADIAESIGLSFKPTSKHVNILHHVDILERRQESLTVYYRLAKPLPPVAKCLAPFVSNSRE